LKPYHYLAKIALILAVIVIMLGAYTRLTDAGLGCPDWPGCYGRLIAPQAQPGESVVQPVKAWTEMVHRYVAGTLGILIIILTVWAVIRRGHDPQQPVITPFLLFGLLIFQAILGMWTVTLKLLPLVVTGHLLGGMALAGLLSWLTSATRAKKIPTLSASYRTWAWIGLVVLAIQLFLGAWTSTNYAALACGAEFPSCQHVLWPLPDWRQAFDLLSPVGPNYEGGRLLMAARMTIQMVHRYWAIVTFIILLILGLTLLPVKALRGLSISLLVLLCGQVALGIWNVVGLLPLAVAVLHNGVAVLLLIVVVTLLQKLYVAAA
jgi:heme a synthase